MNIFEIEIVKRIYDEKTGKLKHRTFRHEVAFPSSADEITFKMWSDYFQKKADDPEWVNDIEKLPASAQLENMGKWDGEQWVEYYILVLEYLSCFSESDLSVLADAPLMAGDSLLSIYFQIIGIINTYEPTIREEFEYKGDKYIIDKVEVDRFGRTQYGKNLSANQVIDALQYEHIFSVKNEDGMYQIKDRKFQIDIALISLLSKKVMPDGSLDERPLDYVKRQEWTENKIMHFMDAPMSLALDVDFFLRSSRLQSLNTLIREPYLKLGKSQPTQSQ